MAYDPQQNPPPQGMTVQSDQGQTGQQDSDQQGGLFDRWNSWIDRPGNRAAMMQFGIAMLQPMQPGENWLSHGANALGYGGEAEARVAQQQQHEDLLESQARLRESQAGAAQTRAEAAQTAAAAREQSAGFTLERVGMAQQQRGLQNLFSAQAGYQKAKSDYEKQELDPLNPSKSGQPFPDFETWMHSTYPGIDPRTGAGIGVGQGGAPSGAPRAPQDQTVKPKFDTLRSDPKYGTLIGRMLQNPDPKAKAAVFSKLAPFISDAPQVAKQYGIPYTPGGQ